VPPAEIALHLNREHVPRRPEGNDADQAVTGRNCDTPIMVAMAGRDRRTCAAVQDIDLEPAIDLGQHLGGHRLPEKK
jgi:hypothetical protein